MALTVPVAEIVENSNNPLLGKHESWGRILLGDIATIQNGFPFKSSQFTQEGGMPLIRIRNVGVDSTDTKYVGEYDPTYVVEAGDLLIGMDGDFNCARWRGPYGLLNQRVCRVTLKSDIYHPKLLDYALPGYLKAINEMTSSVTVKHLSSKSIAEIPLPLPPMDQQKRIVAEIEKQFSRLDEAVANLKRVKANLKRYKAAVLKAAVEGRLVETEAELARREGRSYETGKQLLQRILETRRSQWKGKSKYKEPAVPDTTDLPDLPEGWMLSTVEQLTTDMMNGYSKRSQVGGRPQVVLRLADVVNGEISTADVRRINCTDEEVDKYALQVNDLLVLRVNGSPDLVGRFVFVHRTPVVALYCDHFIRARCVTSDMAIWLRFYSDVEGCRRYIDLNKVSSAGQNTINQGVLSQMTIPLPPVSEQHRIIAELERRLTLLRNTEAQVDVNIQRASSLQQTILMKAFSGLLEKH